MTVSVINLLLTSFGFVGGIFGGKWVNDGFYCDGFFFWMPSMNVHAGTSSVRHRLRRTVWQQPEKPNI